MEKSKDNIIYHKAEHRHRITTPPKTPIFPAPYMELARGLHKLFISGSRRTSKEFSIFLCGGSGPSQDSLRREIGDKIQKKKSKYRYSVHYPEDMFIELILGHLRKDLLSLENILAESSHAIAILLTSPGTFTELGAFANHELLRNKLIIVIDPKYKRNKSFINLGPVRYLQKETKSRIHYITINESNISLIAETISDSCRSFDSSPRWSLLNPLLSIEFYLAMIYVFDPISREGLINTAISLENNDNKQNIILAAETVINGLINKGQIICNSGFLSTTQNGTNQLLYSNRTKTGTFFLEKILTTLRFEALNLMYRKNKGGAFRNLDRFVKTN